MSSSRSAGQGGTVQTHGFSRCAALKRGGRCGGHRGKHAAIIGLTRCVRVRCRTRRQEKSSFDNKRQQARVRARRASKSATAASRGTLWQWSDTLRPPHFSARSVIALWLLSSSRSSSTAASMAFWLSNVMSRESFSTSLDTRSHVVSMVIVGPRLPMLTRQPSCTSWCARSCGR